jgi:hypothetical protein
MGMKEPEAGPPSNADRAALAKILTVLIDRENCEAAMDEIRRIAVRARADPQPDEYWHGWLPDPEHFNALPYPLRTYIHELETRADPAGDVAAIAFLKDTVDALPARIREMKSGDQ